MEEKTKKYLFFGMFMLILILSFFVIKPFITSILSSIVLAYLFYPLYKLLTRKINHTISAFLILILVILIFIIPSYFVINSLIRESVILYNSVNGLSLDPLFSGILDKITKFILDESQSLLRSLPKFILNVFITLFLFYYFLKDGEKIVIKIKELIPLSKVHKELVVKEFKRVTSAVVYGLILIGLIVGVFAFIGFYLFKIPNPILWSLITIVISILPGIGSSAIWLPASLIKLYQGDYFSGIGLFIYGMIFISGFEMFFKPRLISHKSDIHPTLVVLGVFGGIALLGFIGLFFGPLILVISITFLKHLFDKS